MESHSGVDRLPSDGTVPRNVVGTVPREAAAPPGRTDGTTNGVAAVTDNFPSTSGRTRRSRDSASAARPIRGACGSRTIPGRRPGAGSWTRSPARDTNGWSSARMATCRPRPGSCAASSRPAACAWPAGLPAARCTGARSCRPSGTGCWRSRGWRARWAPGTWCSSRRCTANCPTAASSSRPNLTRTSGTRWPRAPTTCASVLSRRPGCGRVPPACGEPCRDRRADPPLPGRH